MVIQLYYLPYNIVELTIVDLIKIISLNIFNFSYQLLVNLFAIFREQTINEINKLITVANDDFNALIDFQNRYREDMKPFSNHIEELQKILIFVLEDLALKYKGIEQEFKVVINGIKEISTTSKFKDGINVFAISTAMLAAYSVSATSDMLRSLPSNWRLYVFGATLSIMCAFYLLQTSCFESFTERDKNLIGLRKVSHSISLLIAELTDKMHFEEDNGKFYRTYLETIKSIEKEYNSIIDLILSEEIKSTIRRM
jgi:hypothetical protein